MNHAARRNDHLHRREDASPVSRRRYRPPPPLASEDQRFFLEKYHLQYNRHGGEPIMTTRLSGQCAIAHEVSLKYMCTGKQLKCRSSCIFMRCASPILPPLPPFPILPYFTTRTYLTSSPSSCSPYGNGNKWLHNNGTYNNPGTTPIYAFCWTTGPRILGLTAFSMWALGA